jgi:AcrR family transcriptional regulator
MSRQIDRTRATIRDAFQKLVFLKRYGDIRMAEVASAANVGRSTLYTHFGDKDSILVDN